MKKIIIIMMLIIANFNLFAQTNIKKNEVNAVEKVQKQDNSANVY